MTGRVLRRCALPALAALALAACAAEPQDTVAPASLGTAALAAGEVATVHILAPPNNADFFVASAADIPVTFEVVDGTIGPDDLHLNLWLDGTLDASLQAQLPYTFSDVPCGYHQLTLQLVTADGEGLANPSSVDSVIVRVRCPCDGVADCEDDNPCSAHACSGDVCAYGPVPGCCSHDLECPFGWTCQGESCVQCGSAIDCDDGDVCTTDYCTVDGLCDHIAVEGCCNVATDCDDGLYCTTDSCNFAAHTCEHAESQDPLCCNTTADCKPDDPCTKYMCYANSTKSLQYCRYGPPEVGCCTLDGHCKDGNPCTIDSCVFDDPDSDKGACIYDSDPQKPSCCLSSAECDDDDPSTSEVCTNNTCEYSDNPLYCELPGTSSMVINELQVAPAPEVGALGEYIELYNASEEIIDLVGWTLVMSGGQFHTIGPEGAVGSTSVTVIVPGVYFVLGRTADKDLNGGFIPHYAYGGDLALPDPWETGGPVTHTVTLLDPEGVEVDTLTYDSATWPLEERRALELTHPWADNALPGSWRAAGHSASISLNTPYGTKAYGQHGSPKSKNKSSLLGLLHEGCEPPDDASPCAEGRCNLQSTCEWPLAETCCTEDADCEDGDICSVDACDVGSSTCYDAGLVDGCCTSDSQCDDDNPCNLDRCIGNTCRYSPNIIAGCCASAEECDDQDPCTVDGCDVGIHACFEPTPVELPAGQQCCATSDECDDGDLATLDLCDPGTDLCIHPPDVEFCDSAGAACEDNDPCTVDTCDVGAQACEHAPIAGCCDETADCPSDGNPCTAEACDVGAAICVTAPVEGCCLNDGACDDGVVCTKDTCGNNTCHHTAIADCCEGDGDCDDGSDCTTDSCDVGASECLYESLGTCCTPGAGAAQLANECGDDPDGPALLCWTWTCSAEGACVALQDAECCAEHVDCADGDGCTVDVCGTTGVCKHFEDVGNTFCCADDSDCPAHNYCDAELCTPLLPDGDECFEAGQCLSGLCEDGICQPPGVVTTFAVQSMATVHVPGDGAVMVFSVGGPGGGVSVGPTHVIDWTVMPKE